MSAYMGKLLRVDLNEQTTWTEEVPQDILRRFMGGKGLAAYYLYQEIPAGADPLGPENRLAFMAGPLTGSRAPSGVNLAVCAKSPLTGTWCDSHVNGTWGRELKQAGYDGIIVEGASEDPVYLHIEDDRASLRSAGDVWGMDTFHTMRYLKNRHEGSRVASIGSAGEKLGLLASVIMEVRAAGRGGMGAVMGSKNLKAIVVSGSGSVDVARPEEFKEVRGRVVEMFRESPSTGGSMPRMGTAGIISAVNEAGCWPTRNYQRGSSPLVDELSGEAWREHVWGDQRYPCPGCVIQCGRFTVIEDGPFAGLFDEGPEYETITLMGSNCEIGKREAIAYADYLCDAYGMDTISVGNTIGFLMECMDRALISPDDLDGVDLRFGNIEAFLEAVRRAGTHTGELGRLVVNGVMRAAQEIGGESERFAIHAKGLEFPAYEPRAAVGMGLAYAVSDRGACHLRPYTVGMEALGGPLDPAETTGKGEVVLEGQGSSAIMDSIGLCKFVNYGITPDEIYELFNAVTGLDMPREEYDRVGRRVNYLTRRFNNREGFTREDDALPGRITGEPLPDGPNEGVTVDLEPMLEEYYREAGFTEDGQVPDEILREYDLEFAIEGE